MKPFWIISMLCLGCYSQLLAQEALNLYRGNQAYLKKDYSKAEEEYQKTLDSNPLSFQGIYNKGNSKYQQEEYEEALASFKEATEMAASAEKKAQAFHNLGNAHLQANQLKESVEAYKQALRLNPHQEDTRYNLAFAMEKLKEQEKQEQEEQDQDQDQDKENKDQEEKEQKDQENKDQQDKGEQEEDKEGEEQKDQEKKEQGDKGDKEEEGKPQKPQPINVSPREAEQMLEAARNEDQRIQMMLRKEQQQGTPKKIEKDW